MTKNCGKMVIKCHQIIFNRKDLADKTECNWFHIARVFTIDGEFYFLSAVKISKKRNRNFLIDDCIVYESKQVKWDKPDIYYSIFWYCWNDLIKLVRKLAGVTLSDEIIYASLRKTYTSFSVRLKTYKGENSCFCPVSLAIYTSGVQAWFGQKHWILVIRFILRM